MYKLFLDKSTEFVCEVSVKNASLKNAFVRMIVESSDGPSLLFKGTIKDGKCIVPIARLKGLLNENSKGKMNLEVVVEDTYFTPWQDDFSAEEHTSVKVKIEENHSVKPLVTVSPIITNNNSAPVSLPKHDAVKEILFICERFGINKNTIINKKNDFKNIVKRYFEERKLYVKDRRVILKELSSCIK